MCFITKPVCPKYDVHKDCWKYRRITFSARNAEIYLLNSNCSAFQNYLYCGIHYSLSLNCGKDTKTCPWRIGCICPLCGSNLEIFLSHIFTACFSTSCGLYSGVVLCVSLNFPLRKVKRNTFPSWRKCFVILSGCLFLLLPLERRASVTLFVSLQFLNLRQSVGLFDGGSARRKAATYIRQHKHRINAHRHLCLERDSSPRSQRSSGRRHFLP
jgi:hypothetical protein